MPITENREHLSPEQWARMSPIKKADFTLAFLAANGGLMEPEQAQQFWDIAIRESDRMRSWAIIPMKSDTFKIDRFGFTSRVLHAGTTGQALPIGQRSTPALGQSVLNPKLFKAQVNIAQEVFEDNIIQEQLRQLVMSKLTEKVRQDMQEILIQSDTTSADNDLAQFEGIIKSITSHVVDAGAAALSKAFLEDALQELPDQYHDLTELVGWTSTKAWINYVSALSNSPASEFAEQIRETAGVVYQPRVMGVPVEKEPHTPNNIGTGSVLTAHSIFKPKNWHVGLHRDVRLKMDEDISADVFMVVVSVRFDGVFANEDATVKIENVLPA